MSRVENTLTVVLWEAKAAGARGRDESLSDAAAAPRRGTMPAASTMNRTKWTGSPVPSLSTSAGSAGTRSTRISAPRMQELVPQLLELMEGSIEDGIRLLRPFRPA
jgi:hypothetical protein